MPSDGLIASLDKRCGMRQDKKQRTWKIGIRAPEQSGETGMDIASAEEEKESWRQEIGANN